MYNLLIVMEARFKNESFDSNFKVLSLKPKIY